MHWLPGSSSQSTRPVPVTYSASICLILSFLILPSSFFRFTLASAAELSTNAALVESGGSEGSTLESGVIQPTGIEEGMEAVKIEGACSTCADGRTQTNLVLDPKCRFTLASPHDWIEITYRRAHHLRGKATPKNDDQDHPRAQVCRFPTSNPCNVYVRCCHQPPRPFCHTNTPVHRSRECCLLVAGHAQEGCRVLAAATRIASTTWRSATCKQGLTRCSADTTVGYQKHDAANTTDSFMSGSPCADTSTTVLA